MATTDTELNAIAPPASIGDKKPAAWTVGVANQFLWATWIVASETWGMLPMNVVLAVIFARNLVKWRREEWFHLEAK